MIPSRGKDPRPPSDMIPFLTRLEESGAGVLRCERVGKFLSIKALRHVADPNAHARFLLRAAPCQTRSSFATPSITAFVFSPSA